MKLKIDLLDTNLEPQASTVIETKKWPYEFQVVRISIPHIGKQEAKILETKLFIKQKQP